MISWVKGVPKIAQALQGTAQGERPCDVKRFASMRLISLVKELGGLFKWQIAGKIICIARGRWVCIIPGPLQDGFSSCFIARRELRSFGSCCWYRMRTEKKREEKKRKENERKENEIKWDEVKWNKIKEKKKETKKCGKELGSLAFVSDK